MRHGATQWNASRRFQGHTDIELSDEGRAQARALAQRLATDRFDRVYASDLRRARETAQIIAEPHGLPVTEDRRLREFAFGDWEGLTWAEIVADRPHLRDVGVGAAKLYEPEGGETFAAVCQRMQAFLDEVQARPEAHVLVVTHAGPLHAAMAVLDPVDPNAVQRESHVTFAPASFSRLAMERGRARLITLNDVRHFDPTGRS